MVKARGAQVKRISETDRRTAILDCADSVFLEQGFQAASMSAIAARLGGSKGTLYNYFASKDELFIACVSRHCQIIQEQMSSMLAGGGALREILNRVGRRHLELVSSEDVVRKFRLIVAEADRAPELGRAFYEMGPARGLELLADYLKQAMARGELKAGDPMRAAQHFLGLCHNSLFKARLCNAVSTPSPAEVKKEIAHAADVFIAAYGTSSP